MRPAELSIPARFPYPAGQAYFFDRTSGDTHDSFLILFKYSQDKAALHVVPLTWLRTE